MKKSISVFLIFSLALLSTTLYAKERRGANIIIIKKDGERIKGELIAVRPNSLLLMDKTGVLDRRAYKDVSIKIADVKVVEVRKRASAGKGLAWGLGIGVGSGVVAANAAIKAWDASKEFSTYFIGAGIFGVVGGLLGALIGGAFGGTKKTIQLEGLTDSELQVTLEYLDQKARIRGFI